MSIERNVANHYACAGLAAAILKAAAKSAPDPTNLTSRDLAPVDEFHIGGIEATERFLAKLGIGRGESWLDIGSGIGGPARYAAGKFGCRVAAIDLTPDFCDAARSLNERVRMGERVEVFEGSALAMPFEDGSFDGAFTIHVGMNIDDKPALYREAHRVLKSGATFGIYDILAGREGGNPLDYPVPWATTPNENFLATIGEMETMLRAAGFEIVSKEDRRNFAREFFEKLRQQPTDGPQPLGLHIVMGETYRQKLGNMLRNVSDGRCGPWEIVCRKR